jgi:hypothetical protein
MRGKAEFKGSLERGGSGLSGEGLVEPALVVWGSASGAPRRARNSENSYTDAHEMYEANMIYAFKYPANVVSASSCN